MADKRKGKKRKEELPFLEEKVEKPSKEEYKVAKWLKKNVSVKRTKFLHHNVEYFTGAKAVDALLNSPWSGSTNESEEPKFTTRQDVTDYLDQMLRHKFFHRAKKVPVTEQELRAKQKKKKEKEQKKKDEVKEEKKEEKEEKKRREEETAESSHAEGGKESEGGKVLQPGEEQREKKKMKIRLEMHIDQYFVDSLDAYVWIYDPIPVYYWLFGLLLVIGAILICMFPLWPSSVRMGVYYLSVATAGFLMLIIALACLRLVVFCLLWLVTLGAHHLWLFPNLTEDVGFFASFWPLYQYEYKGRGSSQKSKKKKKAKDSDNEEEEEEDSSEAESSRKQNTDDGGGGGREEEEGARRRKQHTQAAESVTAEEEDEEGEKKEEERDEDEEEEDTESEGSSQQSQTGKDFEIVDKSEIKEASS